MQQSPIEGETSPFLQIYYTYAEEEEKPPAPPLGGIPRQKVPGWVRWPIRAFYLPFVCMDALMQKAAKLVIQPPYKQIGACKKRGNCCYYILLPKKKGWMNRFQIFWNTEILGFFLRDKTPCLSEGSEVYVMGCRYLNKDGSCRHYRFRPNVCRKWPLIEYFGYPRALKGCGFEAMRRGKYTQNRQIL